jgi:hypothetical protein
MADDKVDLQFLGRQVQILQVDMKDLRATEMRRDAEVAAVRADLARLEAHVDAKFEQIDDRFDRLERRVELGFAAVDAKFDQVYQTMADNLKLVLAAISALDKKISGV